MQGGEHVGWGKLGWGCGASRGGGIQTEQGSGGERRHESWGRGAQGMQSVGWSCVPGQRCCRLRKQPRSWLPR